MNTEIEIANLGTIRRVAEEIFTAGRTGLIVELIHPAFHDHSAPEGMRDRDGFRRIVEFWRGNTSSFQVKVVHAFSSGDWVGMVDETSGVHDRNPVFGVAPNGKAFSFQAVHAFRMVEGRMREHWVQTSLPEVLRSWG
jgi:predicted ester cyclase